MTAKEIMRLLREKHKEDLFVPECKNGPTQTRSHFRMDAWVMRKSWSDPCVTAYEVKVTRADFLGDNKWKKYLDCCNVFAFVCPKGIIKPEELPQDVGLFYVASTGNRIMVQRKPVFRDVEIPESVWRYILMCRTAIVSEESKTSTQQQEWADWLATKAEKGELGWRVSRKIRDIVDNAKREAERAKLDVERYDTLIKTLEANGLNPRSLQRWTLERDLTALKGVDTKELVMRIEYLKKECDKSIEALTKATA